jgi:hypothetical protein
MLFKIGRRRLALACARRCRLQAEVAGIQKLGVTGISCVRWSVRAPAAAPLTCFANNVARILSLLSAMTDSGVKMSMFSVSLRDVRRRARRSPMAIAPRRLHAMPGRCGLGDRLDAGTAAVEGATLITRPTEIWWPAASVPACFGQVLAALSVAALEACSVVSTSRERPALAGALAWPGFVKDGVS